MADDSKPGPGETGKQWLERMARETEARENARNERRGRPDLNKDVWSDDKLIDHLGSGGKGTDELSELLGAWRKDIDSEPLDDMVKYGGLDQQGAADLVAYRSSKNKNKKAKLAKKNKSKWKNAAKQRKAKKDGCAVIAILLLAIGGLAIWGSVEGVQSFVEAVSR